jgi:hypothetical protein
MGSYKLKSAISYGKADEQGGVTIKDYPAGASIELTDAEAQEVRHALVEPPKMTYAPGTSAEDIELGGAEELDEDEQAALESIRKRPDNRESGVMLHWKTDPLARAAVALAPQPAKKGKEGEAQTGTRSAGASGFDRMNTGSLNAVGGGLTGLDVRPEANKTEMELEDEEKIAASNKELAEKAEKKREAAGARASTPMERTVPAAPPPSRVAPAAAPARPSPENKRAAPPASEASGQKK